MQMERNVTDNPIGKAVMEIVAGDGNAEVKRNKDGDIVILEVKKRIKKVIKTK